MVFKSIREILNGRRFASVPPETTLEAAIDLMAAERVTALPVLVGRDLAGIITERDILRHASQRGGFAMARVAEVMTRDVVCAETRGSLLDAYGRMQDCGFGHLPVLDMGGKVVGILTRDDIPADYKNQRTREETRSADAPALGTAGGVELHA